MEKKKKKYFTIKEVLIYQGTIPVLLSGANIKKQTLLKFFVPF
jgi:hypothetical protein